MSNKKSNKSIKSVENRNADCQTASENFIKSETSIWKSLGKMEKIFAVGIFALLSLSVFGFVGSNLFTDEGGRMKDETSSQNTQTPNSSSPNAPNTVTSTTPTLSEEFFYARSRLLAVEDANTNAAPPADLAVWRPANGYFYVLGGLNSTQTFVQWGISGDIPLLGDFDGDGKTDFSIYRPSDGYWWIVTGSSPNNSIALQFGAACTPPNGCDKVAPADYDGDGKTDAAVYRPTTGTWYILQSGSGNSFYSQQFSLPTDVPAPADYDGDGKVDIATWNNTTGNCSIRQSGSNNTARTVQWGTSGDIPVPAYYRR